MYIINIFLLKIKINKRVRDEILTQTIHLHQMDQFDRETVLETQILD